MTFRLLLIGIIISVIIRISIALNNFGVRPKSLYLLATQSKLATSSPHPEQAGYIQTRNGPEPVVILKLCPGIIWGSNNSQNLQDRHRVPRRFCSKFAAWPLGSASGASPGVSAGLEKGLAWVFASIGNFLRSALWTMIFCNNCYCLGMAHKLVRVARMEDFQASSLPCFIAFCL